MRGHINALIMYGSTKEWELVYDVYIKEKNSSIKMIVQEALSKTTDNTLLERYLNDLLNDAEVSKQDSLNGIALAARSTYGFNVAWNFVKNKWDYLCDKYKRFKFLDLFIIIIVLRFQQTDLVSLLRTFGEKMTTEAELDDVFSLNCNYL